MATIKKRGNSYLFRCYAGYNAAGKQIERTMTWNIPAGMSDKKAEKEASQQAALFEERVRSGQTTEEHIKFQDFAERWFRDYADIQLRPTTIERYRDMTTRIYPALGHLYIDRIRPANLMAFYRELSNTTIHIKCKCKINLKAHLKKNGITKEKFAQMSGVSVSVLYNINQGKNIEVASGKKIAAALGGNYDTYFCAAESGKPIATKTIRHYHRLISSIMASAVKWQVIVSNPCDRVDPPKVQQAEIKYLDDVQARHLLDLLTAPNVPTHYRCAVEILLYTGMRRGELLGLEWSDIDLDNQLVSIHRSSLYLADRGIFEDETKNNSSNRVIKIPFAAVKAFRTMKTWQARQRLMLGEAWQGSNKVFTSLSGAPMHPDTLSGWFHDFVKNTDLPDIHLHSLRHTCATLEISNGIAVTTVAGQLGHANASTTTKIYAHAIKTAQAAAADMMDDLLYIPPKKRA